MTDKLPAILKKFAKKGYVTVLEIPPKEIIPFLLDYLSTHKNQRADLFLEQILKGIQEIVTVNSSKEVKDYYYALVRSVVKELHYGLEEIYQEYLERSKKD